MASEIKMPALSPTMETGRLSKWLVAEGDQVRSGDIIAEIETDKTTMEVEIYKKNRPPCPTSTIFALASAKNALT